MCDTSHVVTLKIPGHRERERESLNTLKINVASYQRPFSE